MRQQGFIGAMRALENDADVSLDTHGKARSTIPRLAPRSRSLYIASGAAIRISVASTQRKRGLGCSCLLCPPRP